MGAAEWSWVNQQTFSFRLCHFMISRHREVGLKNETQLISMSASIAGLKNWVVLFDIASQMNYNFWRNEKERKSKIRKMVISRLDIGYPIYPKGSDFHCFYSSLPWVASGVNAFFPLQIPVEKYLLISYWFLRLSHYNVITDAKKKFTVRQAATTKLQRLVIRF